MNIEVEILDSQLRIRELEVTARLQGERAGTAADVAAVRAEVVEVRAAIDRDFALLNIGMDRLRRKTEETVRSSLSEALTGIDGVRAELNDLGLRLDRLLESDSA